MDPQNLIEYQTQATLLVNVRDPQAEYTKYSFPSKTFEYMASGTPFLTTELPGIPLEYKDYLFTIENNSVDEIKAGLDRALALSDQERQKFGADARTFVLTQKNKYIQSKKFSDFLIDLD